MKLDLLLFGRIRSGPFLRSWSKSEDDASHAHSVLAIDQTVPGTKGGSVHVTAGGGGARCARARRPRPRHARWGIPSGPVRWIAMAPPLGRKELRWMRAGAVAGSSRVLRPDAVIERYYNFGGEAIGVAAEAGIPSVLEVNAPVVDHPGSLKALLDRALVVQPMRRWRERICRARRSHRHAERRDPPARPAACEGARAGVGGRHRTLPARRDRVAAVRAAGRRARGVRRRVPQLARRDSPRARDPRAARPRPHRHRRALHRRWPRAAGRARGRPRPCRVVFTGAVPHADMPACLASADIGVAPFDISTHAPLALGFYWSPLKIFEYMASGLPVVAPAVDRIPRLVEHEREGLLYDPAQPGALAATLERLADARLRHHLGAAARARAVRDYSWAAHCGALEREIMRIK
jgi:hypothetical protein